MNKKSQAILYFILAIISGYLGDGRGSENYNLFFVILAYVFLFLSYLSYKNSQNPFLVSISKTVKKYRISFLLIITGFILAYYGGFFGDSNASTYNGWLVFLFYVLLFLALGSFRVVRRESSTIASDKSNWENEKDNTTSQKENSLRDKEVELKRLYRELAKKYHPDTSQNPETQKIKEDIMKKINRAYKDKNLDTLKAFQ